MILSLCERCGARPKAPKKPGRGRPPKYCGQCARRLKPPVVGECEFCHRLYAGNGNRHYCSERCRRRVNALKERGRKRRWTDAKRDAYHRRRARLAGAISGERVLLSEIWEEQDGICGICGHSVSDSAVWPDPMSASLDHIVPLAKGGKHTRENLQLAHLACNSAKKDS